jgi:hypothetical protein
MQYSPKQVRVFARPDAGSQPGRINIAWVLTVVGCFAALLYATPAEAQATRTWVSGIGDDANPCSRTAACKTFAGAISKTAPGGEINCLDPGGFGAVTITKPITISCEAGTAGVLVSGTNAIVVAAGSQDRVVLRGLDINGVGGQGLSGIRFLSGAALMVEKCIIYGFANFGIEVSLPTNGALSVKDTVFPNPNTAIRISPAGGVPAITVDHISITRAGANGIELASPSLVTVNNSMIFGTNNGVITSAGGSVANIDNTQFLSNNIAVNAFAAGSTIQLNNNSIYSNNTAISIAAGATVASAGNNKLSSNVSNGGTPNASTVIR